ncbi:QRFP-like peptide receptor [Ylistrum balloti]|uniref:QRFP-like peptide receptor n=1 Tax=Ylistrum balloti TaxID=509963 RepID=UPI002905863D|nr:QRFP-like peptide receptor [Ylistrum balloti]
MNWSNDYYNSNFSLPFMDLNGSYFISEFEDTLFEYHKPEKIALLCIYIPVFFLALIGNTLVLVMVCINKRFRRNIANFFLVNLAIADLLVTLFCIPLTTAQHVYSPWIYGEFLCKAIGFMQGMYVEASVLTIVCMSVERYLAIRHPMRMRTLCDPRRVKQVILLTWVVAIITMCPLAMYKKLEKHNLPFIEVSYCVEDWPSQRAKYGYELFLFFIVYIIPGFLVVGLYTVIGCSLWKQDNTLQRANSMVNNEARIMGGRRKLARMMIVISILFAVCWLPYFIINLCILFSLDRSIPMSLYPYALLLAFSHSAQNPLLYFFMHRGFHDFVWRLIRCQCQQLRNSRQVSVCSYQSSEKTMMTAISNGNKYSYRGTARGKHV